MEKLNLFTDNTEVQNKGIIEELNKLQTGGTLSKEGPALFLYDYITFEGENIILEDEKKFFFHNINNSDQIDDVDFSNYGWNYEALKDRATLSLFIELNNGDPLPYTVNFTVSQKDTKSYDIFKQFISDELITIQFLGIQFGQIIKHKKMTFKIDSNIIKQIKK